MYRTLLERVLSCAFAPGERIDVNEIAAADGVSPTPVRNALYRLAGAGLLVSHSNEGFFAPRWLEGDVRDFYDCSSALLGVAVARAPNAKTRSTFPAIHNADGDECVELRTEFAFREIMLFCANRRLCAMFADVRIRLRPFRLLEREWIANREAELRRIMDAHETADFTELGRLIDVYHRRRIRFAPKLVSQMYDGAALPVVDGAIAAGKTA